MCKLCTCAFSGKKGNHFYHFQGPNDAEKIGTSNWFQGFPVIVLPEKKFTFIITFLRIVN